MSDQITLYKFIPLSKLERVLDILIQERLYCAPYFELNDPCEGQFVQEVTIQTFGADGKTLAGCPNGGIRPIRSIDEIRQGMQIPRICSLSSDYEDVRLWSFYAESHKGAAIEIQFPRTEHRLHPITYLPGIPTYTNVFTDPAQITKLLTEKTSSWAFESEYRILNDKVYFPVSGFIKAVHFGFRSDPDVIELIRKATAGRFILGRCSLNAYNAKIQKDLALTILDIA